VSFEVPMKGVIDGFPCGVEVLLALGELGVQLVGGVVGELQGDLVPQQESFRRLAVQHGGLPLAALKDRIDQGALLLEALAASQLQVVEVGGVPGELVGSFLEFATKPCGPASIFSILTISVSIITTIMGNSGSVARRGGPCGGVRGTGAGVGSRAAGFGLLPFREGGTSESTRIIMGRNCRH